MVATAPSSVVLRLPEGWLELDPREPDLLAELRRAVGQHWGQELDDERLLSLLAPLAIELRRLAESAEMVLVGLYTRVVPVDGEDLPLVLTAHAVLALAPAPGDLDEVRRVLEVDADTHGLEVRPVELPAGHGVLVAGTTQIRHPAWDSPAPARLRRYFVPVPGTQRLATLSFLTPNVDLADSFEELFDAVAETLSFEWDQEAPASGT